MAITLKLIEDKKFNKSFDATEFVGDLVYPKIDLTSNRWKINYKEIKIDAYIEVDATTEMRVDTIARYLLGTEDYVDVIVKFNKLRNVFDLKKGDVVLIPNLASFFDNLEMVNYKPKNIPESVSNEVSRNSGRNTSVAVKTTGKGSKTFNKGTNGVIVF